MIFQSTPPARGATPDGKALYGRIRYFNPRPPRGGRPAGRIIHNTRYRHFNPRPPRGGRLRHRDHPAPGEAAISIHAPREGGDDHPEHGRTYQHISIHAPREGGDEDKAPTTPLEKISIHAPREGGDNDIVLDAQRRQQYFNPRPPRGGRLLGLDTPSSVCPISIHAPARGATHLNRIKYALSGISIHAPREGGDHGSWDIFEGQFFISIHAPREGGDNLLY